MEILIALIFIEMTAIRNWNSDKGFSEAWGYLDKHLKFEWLSETY